jgi:hypothetical protein
VVKPEQETQSIPKKNAAPERPLCDEWGVYDPAQAGFEAILRRLAPDDDAPGIPVAPAKPAAALLL